MTDDTIHTCSYECERPGCIRAQRDELAARLAASQQQEQAAPPSAPAVVDFAAVASVLRRALRDGVHYGYRRDFILQQAMALEALSQQPAAVDDAMVEAVARAICVACGENPDSQGDARGNEFRWQDYRDIALAAISAFTTAQQPADDGDYYLAADVDAEIKALRAEVKKLRVDRDNWEQQASDRLADWRAEVEALRADAERYRWLRDKGDSITVCDCASDGEWIPLHPKNIDATIDAAMKADRD